MSKYVELTVYVEKKQYEQFREGLDKLEGLIEVDYRGEGEL